MTRLYILGRGARDFERVRHWLDILDNSGADVRLLTSRRRLVILAEGRLQPSTFAPAAAKRGASLRARVVRKAARWGSRLLPGRPRLLVTLKYGNLAPGRDAAAPQYIALSDAVAWPQGWAGVKRDQVVVIPPNDAETHLRSQSRHELGVRYHHLVERMRGGKIAPEAAMRRPDWSFLVTDRRATELEFDLGDYVADAIRLATHSGHDAAQVILDLAAARANTADLGIEHEAAQAIVTLATNRTATAATTEVADRLSDVADEALAAADFDRASRLFTHLLWLVFFPSLHTSAEWSPLVEDPDSWLEPVRRSKVRHHILGRARPTQRQPADHSAPGVAVIRGSYPGFSAPVVEALEAFGLPTTAFVPGTEDRRLVGNGPNEDVVRWLVGTDPIPTWEWLSETERRAQVFVDWADRAAAIAIANRTTGRTVLRIHSADLLSGWIHLTPLDKVDEIVVVSEPMADLVRRIVDVPDTTVVRALPNLVDAERFDRPKNPIASRTVAVVGWAQQVKDPVWALDVLALLRRSDPEWRMAFVGNDFEARGSLAARAYKARFWERMLEEDVRSGVKFVGYTRDLPGVFQDAGFVLSSSLRESFGVALMEGVASGAVPVVRNWPAFQVVDAARRVTDPRWVVEDVEEAAAAILRLGDEPDRATEATHARQWLKGRFVTDDVAAQYVAVVTGAARNGAGAR